MLSTNARPKADKTASFFEFINFSFFVKWVVVMTTTSCRRRHFNARKLQSQIFAGVVREAVSGQEKRLGCLASKHHTHRRVSAPNRRWNIQSLRLAYSNRARQTLSTSQAALSKRKPTGWLY